MSPEDTAQLHGFLRFAKIKRDQHLKEVQLAFQDVVDFKLEEDIYNKDDVARLLQDLKEELKDLMEKEVTNFSHTAALLLRECLEQAAAQNVSLRADTNRLENEAFLNEIATSETDALKATPTARGGQLNSLEMAADARRAAEERDAARRDSTRLQEQFQKLQTSTTEALDERSALRGEVDSLKAELRAAREEAEKARRDAAAASQAAAASRQESARERTDGELRRREQEDESRLALVEAEKAKFDEQLKKYKRKVKELNAELEKKKSEAVAASSESDARVSESRQFQQMKRLMAQKSQQLMEVRKRLAKYEPDDAPTMDDD
ncbi:leucine zipper transcription factor-like protein 1 [Pseudoscourfieldia marina]